VGGHTPTLTGVLALQRTRWRLPLWASDLTFGVVMAAVLVLGALGESHPHQPQNQASGGHLTPVAPWPAYLLVAVAGLVLTGRHRRPMCVLAVSLLAVLAYTGLGYVNGAALLGPVVALYAVAAATPAAGTQPGAQGSPRRAFLAAAGTLVALMAATAAFNPFGPFGGGFILIPGLVAAALFAGRAVANRRAYIEAIRQRAEFAERSKDEEAARRVDAERLRIARELHDVVAHTMATINVQAGVAVHVGTNLPDQTAAALTAIRDASKHGLQELRAILAVLRQADEAEPTAPTPSLTELENLVATGCAAGLPTEVSIHGNRRPLPASVEVAAYRIVQESLTNALRHAGPATACVQLDFDDEQLRIVVTDTGTGGVRNTNGSGHGLLGMRERALAAGGSFDAGPTPHGGFRVQAHLPVRLAA